MRIDAIAIGSNPPHDVNVIIEVPVGGHPIKYELDKEAGTLVVDRFLYTPMVYPGNYGFVPHTLSLDGDPIDVQRKGLSWRQGQDDGQRHARPPDRPLAGPNRGGASMRRSGRFQRRVSHAGRHGGRGIANPYQVRRT
jgi:hypothetical protein